MKDLSRRQLIRMGSMIGIAMILPISLSSCSGFQPKPFVLGNEIGAPFGCKKLLESDPQGDC